MPPAVKFQKEEIARAALRVVRRQGADALTARTLARELGVSVGPIFTWYASMEELRRDVAGLARAEYVKYVERGLSEPVPFLGVGQNYIRFARQEPELYKLLFLRNDSETGGAMEALKLSQALARPSLMRIYNMDEATADRYFRNLWLAAFSFATLIVTGGCTYGDAEIGAIFTELSLALCKAYKEIPGFAEGRFDRDALFTELVKK